ncbi:MAG TPA: hypothetical protein VN081_02540 [Dongiaceae bacterium]|nr:hypothetical protein [Dongiaceae bacterium]
MAYSYVSAVARKLNSTDPWAPVDISTLTLQQIYTQFARCIVTLTNTFTPGVTLYLDMTTVQPMYGSSFNGKTFVSWLANLGNSALPTTTAQPSTALAPSLYRDAWAAGYSVITADYTRSPSDTVPELDKHDLLITKDGIDYNFMASHALVTVNGFYHLSGYSGGNGLYVVKGADNWRNANDTQVGIHSFANVASLQLIPITAQMVFKQNGLQQLGNSAYINVGQSFAGKTPLLVIGGYLHALDNGYEVVGDGIIRVKFNEIPLLERVFESRDIIDLTSLNLATTINNDDQIGIDSLYSDAAITAYLTLSQSFVVLVDTPAMYRRTWKLENAHLPGRYYGYSLKQFPLRIAAGRMEEYIIKQEWGTYVYCANRSVRNNYAFKNIDWMHVTSMDDRRVSSKPVSWTPGFLLEIGSQP